MIKPPLGYDSWLAYAVATMETRNLYHASIIEGDESWWGLVVECDEMTAAAAAELAGMKNTVRLLIAAVEALMAEMAEARAKLDWQPEARIVLVWDGAHWYVRTLDVIEHDLVKDRKIYYCMDPVANDLNTVGEAIGTAREKMDASRKETEA